VTAAVTVIGGGLAGSEAAWALARAGIDVRLYEMRGGTMTEAHRTDGLAELVCSNSFRGRHPTQAPGLLKEEMQRLGSLIMQAGRLAEVPAGDAWAVDRELLSAEVTRTLAAHPRIEIVRERLDEIPAEGHVVIASGPLTHPALQAAIEARVGSRSLAFYDAIAPIVTRESVDMTQAWLQDRWQDPSPTAAYINCPLDEDGYAAFVARLLAGPHVPYKTFEEDIRHFEGCLPIEEMASRGLETLRHGPMKPVGLTDPRADRRPYAVVQLRPDNRAISLLNLVGFQTKMTYGAQQEALRLVPALRDAEFVRLGSLHRNTFIDSPRLLRPDLALRSEPRLRFAGQITGVEGYVESAAAGILAGWATAAAIQGWAFEPPPATTAIGALVRYVSDPAVDPFQPMNINFGLFPDIEEIRNERGKRLKGKDKKQFLADRALITLGDWLLAHPNVAALGAPA
jgi:methylenetetrahydrofolate--tRNA-(uracil-5-)-methyltransferase